MKENLSVKIVLVCKAQAQRRYSLRPLTRWQFPVKGSVAALEVVEPIRRGDSREGLWKPQQEKFLVLSIW